jgi:capsular polysaccharide biosynthesis protein
MNPAASLLDQARSASLAGNHGLAVLLCDKAEALYPANPEVTAYSGLVHWKARSSLRAAQLLSTALNSFPGNGELAFALIDTYVSLGLPRRALAVAAELPPERKAAAMFREQISTATGMLASNSPGEAVEAQVVSVHNAGRFGEIRDWLVQLLDEWPAWAWGHAMFASAMRHLIDFNVDTVDLAIRDGETPAAAQQRWRKQLDSAAKMHRAATLQRAEHALRLAPDLYTALQVEVRARFEAGEPVSNEQLARLQSVAPEGVDGPYALANALELEEKSLSAVSLCGASAINIDDPVTVGGTFTHSKAVGRALLNARYTAQALDATVAGTSDVVLLREGVAICDTLSHALGELTNWRQDRWIALRSSDRLMLKRGPRRKVAGVAVSMLGVTASIYGHWLMDYLPRLRTLEERWDLQGVTFLVDQGLPKTHLQSLELMLGHEVSTQALAPGEAGTVERLLFSGPDVYFPHSVVAGTPDFATLAPASVPAMRYLRDRAASRRRHQTGVSSAKRIMIRRGSPVRRLLNEEQVADQLSREFGFKAVYPEKLSFAEQVELFQDAQVVIGAHGSAMTNCVFCPEGTEAATICAAYAGNLPSWSHSLGQMGIRHRFLIGQAVAGSHPARQHWDFVVDPALLCGMVDEMLSGSRRRSTA